MRVIIKLLVFAGLGWFGVHMYEKTMARQAAEAAEVAATAAADGRSENGFIRTGYVEEATSNVVLILRPANCPSDQAQRAEALDRELTRLGIPHAMGESMSISDPAPTEESVAEHQRAFRVFNQGAPVVFINGMGKSNPTAEEVVAEYRRTRVPAGS